MSSNSEGLDADNEYASSNYNNNNNSNNISNNGNLSLAAGGTRPTSLRIKDEENKDDDEVGIYIK